MVEYVHLELYTILLWASRSALWMNHKYIKDKQNNKYSFHSILICFFSFALVYPHSSAIRYLENLSKDVVPVGKNRTGLPKRNQHIHRDGTVSTQRNRLIEMKITFSKLSAAHLCGILSSLIFHKHLSHTNSIGLHANVYTDAVKLQCSKNEVQDEEEADNNYRESCEFPNALQVRHTYINRHDNIIQNATYTQKQSAKARDALITKRN